MAELALPPIPKRHDRTIRRPVALGLESSDEPRSITAIGRSAKPCNEPIEVTNNRRVAKGRVCDIGGWDHKGRAWAAATI